MLQGAQALAAFLAEKELVIHPEDLLAGHIQILDYSYPLTLGAWNPFLREPKTSKTDANLVKPQSKYPPVGDDTTPFVYTRPDGTPRCPDETAALDAFCRGIRFDDLSHERRFSAFGAYGHSKLASMLFSNELARRLRGSGVSGECSDSVINTIHK